MKYAPIAPRSLAALKPFQRTTVDYVFERLYGPDPVDRFLVADEVGLGKTLVARGVIAKTIDRLHERGHDRIDIVYICSNADIAAQNLTKLHPSAQAASDFALRVTLLPTRAGSRASSDLNFVSFTPGTSFNLGDQFGHRDERLVLYRMLRMAWGADLLDTPGAARILRGDAGFERFNEDVDWYRHHPGGLDSGMETAFAQNLQHIEADELANAVQPLRVAFEVLAASLTSDGDDSKNRANRARLVGRLRVILARTCIDAMRPSLIILDEFQRYRSMLVLPEHPTDDQRLAHDLFVGLGDGAKTLLLSATPYRMYTLADETDSDDHYGDFIKTMEYLLGRAGAESLREELRSYRAALLSIERRSVDELASVRQAVTRRLRRVMCRTERLAVDDQRGGMLDNGNTRTCPVTPADVRAFVALETVSRQVRAAGDAVEYWKSTPYALSFMDSYDVRRRLAAGRTHLPPIVENVLRSGDGMLRNRDVKGYRALDEGNPRLRAVASSLLAGPVQPLWIPPSLPYYGLEGTSASAAGSALTKQLIFSAWTSVPQAIASVLSYEVGRRMLRQYFETDQLISGHHKPRTLLTFRIQDERPLSMTTFLLLYPSPALARLGDPLVLGAAGTRSAQDVLDLAESGIAAALLEVLPPEAEGDDRPNPAWYWAATLLLDAALANDAVGGFFGPRRGEIARAWTTAKPGVDERDDAGNLALHVAAAADVLDGSYPPGPRPRDLASVLARLAVGGPAVCSLRALGRPLSDADREHPRVMRAAARIAWGFRSLYRQPEAAAAIRGSAPEDAYWRRVVDHNIEGCLQAVLDEYVHVLPDVTGHLAGDSTPIDVIDAVASVMYRALTLRTVRLGFTDLSTKTWHDERRRPTIASQFARRFGADATDEVNEVQRSTQVREAFNSPFWPFVPVTTSVGQEGLDFHLYCHRVVHWNLPANPVDLEQREGRVHRYKGHALRRNLAAYYGSAAFDGGRNPWGQMFDAAANTEQARASGGLEPYWIFTGPFKIQRDVPVLPFSREIERYERLRRSRTVYRQVLGQPGQEGLVEFILRLRSSGMSHLSEAGIDARLEALRIDLAPAAHVM